MVPHTHLFVVCVCAYERGRGKEIESLIINQNHQTPSNEPEAQRSPRKAGVGSYGAAVLSLLAVGLSPHAAYSHSHESTRSQQITATISFPTFCLICHGDAFRSLEPRLRLVQVLFFLIYSGGGISHPEPRHRRHFGSAEITDGFNLSVIRQSAPVS